MKNLWKLIIVVSLAAAILAVVAMKNNKKPAEPVLIADTNQSGAAVKLPKLLELGADKCVPCKMMKPIIDELTVEYKGKLDVIFYDVWKNESYAKKYNVEIIPTQIFLDPNEKELFRHQGFFSKDEILAKWKELGFELK